MPPIYPFRGIRYSAERVPDLGEVVVPPYDVIGESERMAYRKKSPLSAVRLILPEGPYRPERYGEEGDWYTEAAALWERWQREEVLRRDPEPAFYVLRETYPSQQGPRERLGFIGLVRLGEDATGSGVLPHERTLEAPKADRLRLLAACRANLGPVYTVFEDAGGRADALLREAARSRPVAVATWGDHRRELYLATEPEMQQSLHSALLDLPLLIADGHHRFESARRYRDDLCRQGVPLAEDSVANHAMIYLANVSTGGTQVSAIHRAVIPKADLGAGEFLERVRGDFRIEAAAAWRGDPARIEQLIERLDRIEGGKEGSAPAIGLLLPDREEAFLLLAQDADEASSGVETLHERILRRRLGVDESEWSKAGRLVFSHEASRISEAVAGDKGAFGFLLGRPSLEKIRRAALRGVAMPQKTTYFHPKLVTGLVFNPVLGDEKVSL